MFPNVDPWEAALWVVASYLAVVVLARLMMYHRDRMVTRFREQVQTERRRQAENILTRKRRAHQTAAVSAPHGPLKADPAARRRD